MKRMISSFPGYSEFKVATTFCFENDEPSMTYCLNEMPSASATCLNSFFRLDSSLAQPVPIVASYVLAIRTRCKVEDLLLSVYVVVVTSVPVSPHIFLSEKYCCS